MGQLCDIPYPFELPLCSIKSNLNKILVWLEFFSLYLFMFDLWLFSCVSYQLCGSKDRAMRCLKNDFDESRIHRVEVLGPWKLFRDKIKVFGSFWTLHHVICTPCAMLNLMLRKSHTATKTNPVRRTCENWKLFFCFVLFFWGL